MTTQFGWWARDPEAGKFQVRAVVRGGSLEWARKRGHFAPWEPHRPSEADWDRLIADAQRRVPRRLLSPKQFAEIRALRQRD